MTPTQRGAGCTPGGGTASSGDGLVFGGGVPVPFHKRYDTHTTAFYDRRQGRHLLTTRQYLGGVGRAIAVYVGAGCLAVQHTSGGGVSC